MSDLAGLHEHDRFDSEGRRIDLQERLVDQEGTWVDLEGGWSPELHGLDCFDLHARR